MKGALGVAFRSGPSPLVVHSCYVDTGSCACIDGLDMLQHSSDAGYAGRGIVQQHMRGLQEL